MIDAGYVLGAILAMGLTTLALRALPFFAARWLQRHALVARLGRFLPPAIMCLLLAHSVVGSARSHAAGPWPELAAVILVVLLQWRSANVLLSIFTGTAAYVLMRNAWPG